MRFSLACSGALGALTACLVLSACGGSTPPAASPEPPSLAEDDDAPAAPAPASSPKVKEGIDAIQAQDFTKAKEILLGAVKEFPKDPQAAFYLGVAVEALGDGKQAAEQYRRALDLDPKLTEA